MPEFVVRPAGIEPAAYCLGGNRSILLSYERVIASFPTGGRALSSQAAAGRPGADADCPRISPHQSVLPLKISADQVPVFRHASLTPLSEQPQMDCGCSDVAAESRLAQLREHFQAENTLNAGALVEMPSGC